MVPPPHVVTSRQLRVLLVEDCPEDAELLVIQLERAGFNLTTHRVETAEALQAALAAGPWDLVLSDYSLPKFSAPEALTLVHRTHPDMPFIIISGTIGEDAAITALKAGADDFIVKGKLARLIPSIERELREVEVRGIRERERIALEEQLRQSQKLEGIGRLAGGIAHDFNNLLTAVLGYTDMILDQIGPDKPISKDLNEIRVASERAVALTRQLLAFSRKQTLNIAPMELNEIVSSMRDMLQRLIGEHISISLQLGPRMLPILADRIQVEQVLMNLVVNARDAMPKGGVIAIETSEADADAVAAATHQAVTSTSYVRLSVADTGTGMDEETRSHIFEPFFTTKGVGEGTGLGLSTVYGVIQQLGGHVLVASRLGHGTTFTLYFPRASRIDQPPVPKVQRQQSMALAKHREVVLVVEDQQGVRQLVSRILTRHGYIVLEAASAMEAVDLFTQHHIDLLLTDVVMPKVGGPELSAQLCAIKPDLKVVFMSGYAGGNTSSSTEVPTNAVVIEKPFKPSAFLHTVRDVLDGRTPVLDSLVARETRG